MKKIIDYKKCFLIFAAVAGFSANIVAQEVEEDIELQDLQTVIKSGTLIAGNDAMPDFGNVVQPAEGSGSITPVLPDVTVQEKANIADGSSAKEKSVFAEGVVGGGYPTLFYGDFSVYRLTGQNPFKISFDHNSAAGYAGKSLNDNFNDSTTQIALNKTFQSNKVLLNLYGDYMALNNGMQNQVSNISDITQNNVNAGSDFTWKFNDKVSAGVILDGEFYNRYSKITGTNSYSDYLKKVTVLDLAPEVFGKFRLTDSLNLDVSGSYWLSTNTDGSIAYDFDGSSSKRDSNRGQVKTGLQWKNNIFKLYGNVAFVVADNMNDNTFVVPFTVGSSAVFPVSFSNRKASAEIEGGLKSEKGSVSELETKYKFAALHFIPQEKSSWYGSLNLSVPIAESFTASAFVDFRKTAFNNGYWQPYYSAKSNGFYGFRKSDLTVLYTDFELSYFHKILSLSAGVKSNWIDVPVLENNHLISASVGLQQSEAKCGATLSADFGLDEDSDPIVPIFALESFVKVTKAVRLAVNIDDIVNLVSGGTRTYAGDYICRSGSASVMAKFFF